MLKQVDSHEHCKCGGLSDVIIQTRAQSGSRRKLNVVRCQWDARGLSSFPATSHQANPAGSAPAQLLFPPLLKALCPLTAQSHNSGDRGLKWGKKGRGKHMEPLPFVAGEVLACRTLGSWQTSLKAICFELVFACELLASPRHHRGCLSVL